MIKHIVETDIATSDKLGLMKVDDNTLGITEEGSVFVKPSILEEIKKAKEDILDLDNKIDKNIELLNEQINALDKKTDEVANIIESLNERINSIEAVSNIEEIT